MTIHCSLNLRYQEFTKKVKFVIWNYLFIFAWILCTNDRKEEIKLNAVFVYANLSFTNCKLEGISHSCSGTITYFKYQIYETFNHLQSFNCCVKIVNLKIKFRLITRKCGQCFQPLAGFFVTLKIDERAIKLHVYNRLRNTH